MRLISGGSVSRGKMSKVEMKHIRNVSTHASYELTHSLSAASSLLLSENITRRGWCTWVTKAGR